MRSICSSRLLAAFTFLFLAFVFTGQAGYSQDDKPTALELVQNNLGSLQLSKPDLSNFYVSDMHTDKLSGALMVYLQQQYKGIIIRDAVYSIAFKEGKVVSAFNRFVKKISVRANSEIPAVSPLTAIRATTKNLNLADVASIRQTRVFEAGRSMEFAKIPASKADIPVKLVWVVAEDSLVKLAWEVHIDPVGTTDMWNVRVDAANGSVIQKDNWTRYCQWDKPFPELVPTKKVISSSTLKHQQDVRMPAPPVSNNSTFAFPLTQSASYLVVPYPVQDLLASRGLQTQSINPWLMAGANNPAVTYGWHFDGTADYPYTRGNNVFARDDRDGNDATDGTAAPSLTSFPNLDFNYTFNGTQRPDSGDNLRAAATNLFYWNNIVHDITYQYGFDEAAGNFQQNNMGRGGTGNDPVIADVQDNSGFNNANFSTPPDGNSGRMQMYLFSRPGTATINEPSNIAGPIVAIEGIFNQNTLLANLGAKTGNVVIFEDSSLTHFACGTARNGSAISGNIALLDRGGCDFVVKVRNAQNAGAIAAIVINNVPGSPISMGGTDNSIVIPAIMISQAEGNLIKVQIQQNVPVNITIDLPPPFLDGDFDNAVVSHEYTHGISNRLTGGLAGYASCLFNAEQMGEGWSDYFALMLTTDWLGAQLTDGTKNREIGKYVGGGSGGRRYPYTTDTSINKWTYGKLATETSGGEEHFVGEIWCATLWDMTWNLIQKDAAINADLYNPDGAGGNSVALKLVTLGLKLQPCSPGFLDGRNAILKADTMLFNGKYSCEIWKAFARRGMGVNARQGSSNRINDQVQNFELPGGARIVKTVNKNLVRQGDEITYTFGVQCNCSPLAGATIRDTLPNNLVYQSGGTLSGNVVTFSPVNLSEQQTAVYTLTAKVNDTGSIPVTHLQENVSVATIDNSKWAKSTQIGNAQWTTINLGDDFIFYAPDSSKKTDFTITSVKSFKLDRISTLSFTHYFDTESGYDGGVVEISINNGVSWIDAGPFITKNGYTSIIDPSANSSIAGRQAFTGYNGPYLLPTTINLSAFSGDSVKFRFRFCSDELSGGDGWYVDDIVLKSESGIINTASLFKDASLLSKSSNQIIIASAVQAPLPVTLTTFSVIKQNSSALVNWRTSSEINASRFEVERSLDGIHFQLIGTVSVAGFSSTDRSYQFTDIQPIAGTNYYRLKQVDLDGKFVYSDIKTIVFDDVAMKISLKPNPSNGVFTIDLPSIGDNIELNIFDSKGILIQKHRLKGGNQLINLSNVPKGVYLLNFLLKDKTLIKKIIIQ